MCQLCIEYNKGKMITKELLSNIGEMVDSNEDQEQQKHLFELADKAISKEMPFQEWESEDSTGMLDELDLPFMPEED